MNRIQLGVNVDHIATLRQQRGGTDPDPVAFALACETYGADSVVCHLREDRRHIQDDDVRRLRASVRTRLNLEMGLAKDIVAVALDVKPDQVTLVPERREELTTEGGLNVTRGRKKIVSAVKKFREAGIEVSLFIDPDEEQVRASREAGASTVELHTGEYANASNEEMPKELARIVSAVRVGKEEELRVVAGHGLDTHNVVQIAAIPEIEELNIGYALVVRSVTTGWEAAIREMRTLLDEARR
ncbi:MAG: pyridoxine 5'-phosphate synthase [Planctomycetota bacterium]|jgi:pyridoxine 5-phosphate synthase